ncbi:polysaccharide deacetylase family protein [Actinoplanes sp. TBRC 11911]|uniref:polysaccharide deacetylase family protein n=1 Tax=Actinoplanes sp. TBRC 11911 TaxID=2729386 RepID=UPI00145D759D|nr:polysaccharide deacetylase family protein [Actinoplanes sp. TBRC 11911]NMO50627.1 polysaccharide deacetylase family protein [Actinoplanes sp. TBRC 11911]
MPPQSSRYPSPAADDIAAGGGRHRRPESLADVSAVAADADVSAAADADVSAVAADVNVDPGVAAAPDIAAGPAKPDVFVPRSRRPRNRTTAPQRSRHQRNTGPRHAAAPTHPPATGTHRAPGTLPIESWLLVGKKRQQILLASLVAIALFLIAVPAQQRRSGVEAVNAAAQRAVGVTSPSKKKAPVEGAAGAVVNAPSGHSDEAKPAPSTSETPTKAPAIPAAKKKPAVNDLGPGKSLRTTGSSAIALTFDDGPDPVQTPKILALLAKYQIKATFCLVGDQVAKHPEVVRQIVAAGHTLCNHTTHHSLTIGKETPEQIRADLENTNAAIRQAVPDAKIPFFRAPGGNFTERLVGVADQLGMTSLYWAVDPRDWDHPKGETDPAHVARVIAEVQKHVKPGSIILSHDFNQPDTIEAYEKLIPYLQEHFTIGLPGGASPTVTVTPSATPSATVQP